MKAVQMKPKSKKKISSNSKQDKLKDYYDNIDWMTWWEEFAHAINENGTVKYATVWSFVAAKTKDKKQRALLWWAIGPEGVSEEYKQYPQFNWETKRENGFWFSSTNADKLTREVKAHTNALASMRELGSVNLTFIARIEALAKEIDKEFSGRIFLPKLSTKENTMRAATYTKLIDQLFSMVERAQVMFGRTQGMDIARLADFFAMFGQGMGKAAANMGLAEAAPMTIEANTASTAMSQIMDMVLQKAAKNEMELPDPDMDAIIVEAQKPTLVARKG